ncbi:MAG: hypothetical protein FWC41_09795 [Firmicutes bacterium]|nr:hypothetical protein [Bacillota bacterium]
MMLQQIKKYQKKHTDKEANIFIPDKVKKNISEKINIICGKNGVGKTELLEDLEKICGYNKFAYRVVYVSSVIDKYMVWDMVNVNKDLVIEILKYYDENIRDVTIDLEYKDDIHIYIYYNKIYYNNSPRKRLYDRCCNALTQLLKIAIGIANAKDTIVFINDFNTDLHYKLLDKLAEKIVSIANENNVQFFIVSNNIQLINSLAYYSVNLPTKHSWYYEADEYAVETDLSVFRLDKIKDKIHITHYNNKEMQIARNNIINIL